MTVFAAFGLAVLGVVGIGNASTATGADSMSPEPSVTYQIRFEHSTDNAPKPAVPRPTAARPAPEPSAQSAAKM